MRAVVHQELKSMQASGLASEPLAADSNLSFHELWSCFTQDVPGAQISPKPSRV